MRGDKIIGKDDTPVVLVLSDELADESVRIWLVGAIRDNDWTPKKLEDVEGVIALRDRDK